MKLIPIFFTFFFCYFKAFLEDGSLSGADFRTNLLMYLSSFAFGIVSLFLQRGGQILEKRRLLRMVAIKLYVNKINNIKNSRNVTRHRNGQSVTEGKKMGMVVRLCSPP